MAKINQNIFYPICISLLLAGYVSPALAVDIAAPIINHTAPSTVYTPSAQFSITINDETELASVGFGPETAPLNEISMKAVSPGVGTVTLQESLSNLNSGTNRFLVIAQDTSGNVSKTIVAITYLQTGASTNLIGAVSSSNYDAWTVTYTNGDIITIQGPMYTLVLGQNLVTLGCIGSTGSLSLPASAFGGPNASFIVGMVGQYTGAINYVVNIQVTGATPTVSAAYTKYSTTTFNDAPSTSLTYLGINSTDYANCQ